LLDEWTNPVFGLNEEPISRFLAEGPSVANPGVHQCFSQNPKRDFQDTSSLCALRLSKAGLLSAIVVRQVDNKFILVKMRTGSQGVGPLRFSENGNELLALIDQHAADERIRVEGLLVDLCKAPSKTIQDLFSPLGFTSAIDTIPLVKPVTFSIRANEYAIFKSRAAYFARWGILFDLTMAGSRSSHLETENNGVLTVLTIPGAIVERCKLDTNYLLDLMRKEIWNGQGTGSISDISEQQRDPMVVGISSHDWLERLQGCPQGILDLINSRSCRSAIMFNDQLTLEDCKVLVKKLAHCHFPFQCAHGRPSMVPLVNIETTNNASEGEAFALGAMLSDDKRGKNADFITAWTSWK
jgi:DNA mismatch repair protein MLH3